MRGEIKGWTFARMLYADGTTTRDAISAEKTKLEARLVQIPSEIAAYETSIANMQKDYDWLSSLDKSHQKSYQKDHGIHPHEAAAQLLNKIAAANAAISSLKQEKSRIPIRLEELQKQLDALVRGESDGLAKGLDKESAQVLGEIELQKEQARLEHDSKMQEIELQQAEQKAAEEKAVNEQGKNTKLIIGIIAVALLALIGFLIYRSRQAAKLAQTVNPLPS